MARLSRAADRSRLSLAAAAVLAATAVAGHVRTPSTTSFRSGHSAAAFRGRDRCRRRAQARGDPAVRSAVPDSISHVAKNPCAKTHRSRHRSHHPKHMKRRSAASAPNAIQLPSRPRRHGHRGLAFETPAIDNEREHGSSLRLRDEWTVCGQPWASVIVIAVTAFAVAAMLLVRGRAPQGAGYRAGEVAGAIGLVRRGPGHMAAPSGVGGVLLAVTTVVPPRAPCPGESNGVPSAGASARDELLASRSEGRIGVRVACEKLRVPTTRQEGSRA
jgi:hypothetical protein